MAERDLRTLQALVMAKAVAGVELLLEDACERWEAEATLGRVRGNQERAEYLTRKLERATELAAEIRSLAAEIGQG